MDLTIRILQPWIQNITASLIDEQVQIGEGEQEQEEYFMQYDEDMKFYLVPFTVHTVEPLIVSLVYVTFIEHSRIELLHDRFMP